MKKFICFLLLAITILPLFSCTNDIETNNTFTRLKDNEVLTANNSRYMNLETETETIQELEYIISVSYTLYRSSYSPSSTNTSIYYNGYYYYWIASSITEKEQLGLQTVKSTTVYEYLPLVESESVVIRSITKTETTFDYKGGWIEKDVEVKTNLSGFFSSFDILKTDCPELAELIDTDNTRKYYIDVTVPDNITYNSHQINSYYYIDKR